MSVKNILLAGVGGQGIILSSEILSTVFFESGFDVKKNEIHGMSQRGGDVTSHLRYGEKVFSPVIEKKCADFVIAFELLEGARISDYVKENGYLIVNTDKIEPAPVVTGDMVYPEQDKLETVFKKACKNVVLVDGKQIMKELAFPKGVNVLLLGVISKYLDIELDLWYKVLKEEIKAKFIEVNLKVFEKGRSL